MMSSLQRLCEKKNTLTRQLCDLRRHFTFREWDTTLLLCKMYNFFYKECMHFATRDVYFI